MTKLIVGCGYVGQRAAAAWRAAGETVHVVTRSTERAAAFEAEGFESIVADVTDASTLHNLPLADTVLYAVGYDRRQALPIHDVYADGLKHVLDSLPRETGRIIYISSTGVYGDSAGEWIDEHSPCEPEREGGRACIAAEQVLAAHLLGQRAVVLRLAGIYGPGRVPRREDLLAGKPIPGSGDGYLNLIHVDDAVRTILAAEARINPPRMYLVSDGNPVLRRQYHEVLAKLLGAPPPQFENSPALNSSRARGSSDKRVRNSRMLAELGVELAYPSFREGLAAIVRGA